MLSLLAALALSQADAGTLDPTELTHRQALYGHCPDAPDAIPSSTPDGGTDWKLPHPRGERLACLLATCMKRDEQLEPLVKFDGVTLFVLGAVAGAAVVGSVVGIVTAATKK